MWPPYFNARNFSVIADLVVHRFGHPSFNSTVYLTNDLKCKVSTGNRTNKDKICSAFVLLCFLINFCAFHFQDGHFKKAIGRAKRT